jgi:phage shock protein PspC (stress-responsive transcriptional regulator)
MMKTVRLLLAVTALFLGACSGGINAGGESPTNNGGIAFIALAGMLILAGIILWIILGREE